MPILSTIRQWLGRWFAPTVTAAPLMLRAAGGAQSSGEIREASGRSVVDWTPAMIKSALLTADGGNLRRVADLCDDILGDDRAAAVFATRRNALFASPLSFEASGDGRRKKRAVHALEAEEDWWTLFPEEEMGELLTWGWVLGIGLGELVPPQDIVNESRYVPTLKVWHPRALRFDWPTRKWFLAIEGGTEIEIEPGDGRWILCTPYGRHRPWARGLWRGMAPLRLLKRYALADVGLYSEVHGQPIRVGFAPTGQGANASVAGVSPSLRKELAADLAQLGRETVIALPPGFDFKLVEATAKTHEVFFAQIELANTSYSVVAIGTNLPTEVEAGVGTGATAQNMVREDYKRADAMMASTMTRWQALVWWAWWNFGDKALAPWPVWSVDPPEDKQATATTWKTVGDALVAFAAVGMKVEPKDLEERFGIKLIAAPELLPPKPLPPSLPGEPGEKPGEPKEKTKPEDKQA